MGNDFLSLKARKDITLAQLYHVPLSRGDLTDHKVKANFLSPEEIVS